MPKHRLRPPEPAKLSLREKLRLRALKGRFHLASRIGKIVGLYVLGSAVSRGSSNPRALEEALGATYSAMAEALKEEE